jgi:FAD/FMN-containing dehydrogenase
MTNKSRRRFIKGALASLAGAALAPQAWSQTARINGFKGRIVEKGDAVYEAWRHGMVWQMRKPARFPELIVRPQSAADVAAALRFAARSGLRAAVRSGGHHIWGASLRDGSLLIDLSEFKSISVAEGRGTARIGPSLWARDIMDHLAPFGYAFPAAHCATVPLGGYALGGGLGLNGDEWGGMASNCIIGGTLVTATGELVRVSETENEDLLWAMRGGGGALPGVVTDIEVRTFARPAGVFSATYVFPLPELDSALALLQNIVNLRPRSTELLALMLHNPQAPADAPAAMKKAIAVRAQVYADSAEAAAGVLDAIAAFPETGRSAFSLPSIPESFEKLFVDSMDWRRGFGFGRFAVENAWTNDLHSAVTAIAEDFIQAPSWKAHVVIQPKLVTQGGDAAFSVSGNTYIGLYSVWDEADQDTESTDWLRRASRTLDEHAVGHYVNEIDAASDTKRLRKCFSEKAWARLRNIREQWDPDRVLHDFPGLS